MKTIPMKTESQPLKFPLEIKRKGTSEEIIDYLYPLIEIEKDQKPRPDMIVCLDANPKRIRVSSYFSQPHFTEGMVQVGASDRDAKTVELSLIAENKLALASLAEAATIYTMGYLPPLSRDFLLGQQSDDEDEIRPPVSFGSKRPIALQMATAQFGVR